MRNNGVGKEDLLKDNDPYRGFQVILGMGKEGELTSTN